MAVVGLSLCAAADESIPQPKRTLLERHPEAGVPGKEIVIGTASLPPGSALPFHTHPGDEIGYVLKGSVIWRRRGQPDRTLAAGDSFFNPRGSIHTLGAAADGEGGTVVSTWIVDADQEMSTPVP